MNNRLVLIRFLLDNNKIDFKSELLRVYPDITLTNFWANWNRTDNFSLAPDINFFVGSTTEKANRFLSIAVPYIKTVENYTTEPEAYETIRLLPTNQQIEADRVRSRAVGIAADEQEQVEIGTPPQWYTVVSDILGGTSSTNIQQTVSTTKPDYMIIGLVIIGLVIVGYFIIKKMKA